MPSIANAQISQYESSDRWSSSFLPSDSTWIAATKSDKNPDIWLQVSFSPSNKCSTGLLYSKPSPPHEKRLPDGPIDRTFELRIDNNEIWSVKNNQATAINGLSIDGTKAIFSILINVNLEFVAELTTGSYLRLFDKLADATDRFSLRGSNTALNRAYSNCKKMIEKSDTPLSTPPKKSTPTEDPPVKKDQAPTQTNLRST